MWIRLGEELLEKLDVNENFDEKNTKTRIRKIYTVSNKHSLISYPSNLLKCMLKSDTGFEITMHTWAQQKYILQ